MQNNFFGSKLNTVLLFILIIIVCVCIWILIKDKQIYFSNLYEQQTTNNIVNIIVIGGAISALIGAIYIINNKM